MITPGKETIPSSPTKLQVAITKTPRQENLAKDGTHVPKTICTKFLSILLEGNQKTLEKKKFNSNQGKHADSLIIPLGRCTNNLKDLFTLGSYVVINFQHIFKNKCIQLKTSLLNAIIHHGIVLGVGGTKIIWSLPLQGPN